MRQLRVYTASKLKHAPMWIEFYTRTQFHFTARWPFVVGKLPDDPCYAVSFWQDDLEDVARSDVVLVYAEEGEKLRGGLVEAGAGLALGKRVIVVGYHDDYGTWQYHPLVSRAVDLDQAFSMLHGMRAKLCP